jgi:hypothetical protein
LNGENQNPSAAAPMVLFESAKEGGRAVADLTRAYETAGATQVRRGVALRDGRSRVLVQDELELFKAADVLWTMHTRAKATVAGSRATLHQGDKTLEARILSPANAQFSFEEVNLPTPQRSTKGLGKLLIRLPQQQGALRIAVLLVPGADRGGEVKLAPLEAWGTLRQ